MGDVIVKFRYEESDIAGAMRSRLPLALVACALVGVAATIYAPGTATRAIVGAVAGVLVLTVVAALVLLPRLAFRRRPELRAPMTLDASDEGLTIVAGTSAQTIPWADCARVEIGRRVIVIRHGEEALLVPRRAFRSPERERAFLDFLSQASRDMRRFESGKSTPIAKP